MSENKDSKKPASPPKKDERDAKKADEKEKPKGKDAPKEEELVSINHHANKLCYRAKKISK